MLQVGATGIEEEEDMCVIHSYKLLGAVYKSLNNQHQLGFQVS
jgi:hypothetical protein